MVNGKNQVLASEDVVAGFCRMRKSDSHQGDLPAISATEGFLRKTFAMFL